MNHWHHIPHEKVPPDGFTTLRLEPGDIKSEIEALPTPSKPKPLDPEVVRLKQNLARLEARANADTVGLRHPTRSEDYVAGTAGGLQGRCTETC